MQFLEFAWIGLVVLALLSWLFGRRSISSAMPAPVDQSVLDIEMEGAAERAVDEAWKRYQVELDFSRASVHELDEKILEQLHVERMAGTLADAEFSRNAVLWGAYVGEVLRRELDGVSHWQRDSKLGPETFPVVHDVGDARIPCESFPGGWCVKRIQNGPEDKPWVELESILAKRSQPQSNGPQ